MSSNVRYNSGNWKSEIRKKLYHLGLNSYLPRHSWATIAKKKGIPTAVISEGLGHETEKTKQIYFDSIDKEVLDDNNDLITG